MSLSLALTIFDISHQPIEVAAWSRANEALRSLGSQLDGLLRHKVFYLVAL